MVIEVVLLIAGLFGTYHLGKYHERVELEQDRIDCRASLLESERLLAECVGTSIQPEEGEWSETQHPQEWEMNYEEDSSI